ncbi:wax ester/triacylglycerol synthase domain-containing protein [Kitasatospora griseola]|uniref:wax ester/triacylglycerol synthase domain-containing protein n=1 Tax=Kitasatospora griseola TaxID=2064 RepID=UPI0036DDBE02
MSGQKRTAGVLWASPADRIMLAEARAGAHDSRVHVGVFSRMPGPAPAPDEVRALLADAVDRAPTLTYRITGRGRRAHWEVDPGFDLDRHVVEYRVRPGRSLQQAVMDALRAHPLPREHPLWSVIVLHGHRQDEYALCYRAHHAFQDGMAVARTCEAVFGGAALHRPEPQPAPERPPTRLLLTALRDFGRIAWRPARWLPRATRTGTPTPALHTAVLDADAVRAIAAGTGATPAQIGLAVLAGALRAWQPQHWTGRPARRQRRGLPTLLSMSLRPITDRSALGTRAGLLPVALPCAEPSPLRRLDQVRAHGASARISLHHRAQSYIWRRLPYPLIKAFWTTSARTSPGYLVTTSYMLPPGLRGSAVDTGAVFTVPQLMRGSVGTVQFIVQGAVVTASLLFDPAVPDVDRLPNLLAAALADLHAALPDTATAHGGGLTARPGPARGGGRRSC